LAECVPGHTTVKPSSNELSFFLTCSVSKKLIAKKLEIVAIANKTKNYKFSFKALELKKVHTKKKPHPKCTNKDFQERICM
jgi:hypothetical protein